MKELTIKLRLDRSHEKAQNAAAIADTKKLDSAYKEVAATRKRLEKEVSDARKKFDKESADAAKKSRQETIKDEKEVSSVISQEQKRVSREQKAALADTTKAQKQAAREAGKVWQESHKKIQGATEDNTLSVGKLTQAYLGYSAVASVIGAVRDMWVAQRTEIENSIDRMVHYREAILELAALKDRMGRSTPELKAQLDFRSKTLQSKEAAATFQAGALNTGQASIASEFITKENFTKLMEMAGSYQAANPGADPKALGELVGIFPSLIGSKNQNPEDIMKRMAGAFNTISKGGSDIGVGISQFAKNSTLSQMKLFNSPEEQLAVQSLFSIQHQGNPGDTTNQFVRGMMGMTTRGRKAGIEGSEAQYEYGAELGVTPGMKSVEIGKRVAEDLKKQAAANPNFDAYNYLHMKGMTDQDTKMAAMEFAQGINGGTFEKTFGKESRGEAIPTLDQAMKGARDFQKIDPVAQARKVDLAKDQADATLASSPEGLYLNAKRIAFESLRARGKTNGTFEEQNKSLAWEGQIMDEVLRMTNAELAKVGLPAAGEEAPGIGSSIPKGMGFGVGTGPLGGNASNRAMYSNKTRAETYASLYGQIQDRGVDPTAAILAEIRDLARKQLDATEKAENKAIAGPNKVAAAPLAPVQPPLRGPAPVPTR